MLKAIFSTWDRDGSGDVDFLELLPHYMKASNHTEMQEGEVRTGFDKFMQAKGKDPKKDGIDFELFTAWLGKASDAQVAAQYVHCVEGVTEKPYAMNIDKAVIKELEGKPLKEILNAPISAIQGLSDMNADTLGALGLKTVRDLGSWKFFLLARAIHTLADKEDQAPGASGGRMNIREALDRVHEAKTLKQVCRLHPSAFNMFPESADAVLAKLRIKTIEHLATRKTFAWANAMVELEKFESAAQ